MSDFCKQCSIEIFNEDHKELAGLAGEKPLSIGYGMAALCEGCGSIVVDNDGVCIADWCEKHGPVTSNHMALKR